MNYLKQNASGLYLAIQQIGCFFRAALHMAELATGKALTVKQINEAWDKAKNFHYIGEINGQKDCVITSAAIANLGLRLLGDHGRFLEVGIFKAGRLIWYSGTNKMANFWIQKITQNGPNKTHFLNINADGSLIWDPHEPGIKPASVQYTICYRYEGTK